MSEIHLKELPDPPTLSPKSKPAPEISKVPGTFSYAPSDDGTDENLLILLHGLGDTHLPFYKMGKSLRLPQTAILVIRAPEQVPFLYEDAFQWYKSFDDLGEMIERPNPTPAFHFLTNFVDHLTTHCAWPTNRIHFFGFAQGGSVAAEFVIERWKAQLRSKKAIRAGETDEAASTSRTESPLQSFGSVVTISGPLISYPTLSSLCPGPLLVCHRSPPAETAFPPGAIAAFKKAYQLVTESKMSGKSTGMPASKEEWEPIMRFWSQRLSRRQAEGLYEVMTGSTGG